MASLDDIDFEGDDAVDRQQPWYIKLLNYMKDNPKVAITAIISIVIVITLIMGFAVYTGQQKKEDQAKHDASVQKSIDALINGANKSSAGNSKEGTDQMLIQSQDQLSSNFGKAPAGAIWDWDGTPIFLGDNKTSSEDVLYKYLKGISTLDLGVVQKYSRGSSVYKTYSEYFDTTTAAGSSQDSKDVYVKNLYKEAMKSVQVKGITNTATFANSKVVYTVKMQMLDLGDKNFVTNMWLEDMNSKLYKYTQDESDQDKADKYLQDYLIKYYGSEKAKTTTLELDITLQKYADLNTGWLVSIDSELDNALKNQDGNGVFDYVKSQYQDYAASASERRN